MRYARDISGDVPFINPIQLQYNLETAPTAAILLSSLILKSGS
jgi:hypothetical protein